MYEILDDNAFDNLVQLYEVWRLAIKRPFLPHEVSLLKEACLNFVTSYQAVYYKGKDIRLQACSITHHWLLRLADSKAQN